MRYRLGEQSRMKSKKQIAAVFNSSTTGFVFPLKCLFNINDIHKPGTTQVLITVPKRIFKSAVKRNKIKRLIREVYRLQRPDFEQELLKKNIALDIAFIYVGKTICDYHKMESVMESLIYSILKKYSYSQLATS